MEIWHQWLNNMCHGHCKSFMSKQRKGMVIWLASVWPGHMPHRGCPGYWPTDFLSIPCPYFLGQQISPPCGEGIISIIGHIWITKYLYFAINLQLQVQLISCNLSIQYPMLIFLLILEFSCSLLTKGSITGW